MGKEFGKLQRLKGINFYYLSPYEMNPYKGMFNPGIMNTLRRCRESFFMVTIPVALVYIITSTANEVYEKSIRKNPDDYKDEV